MDISFSNFLLGSSPLVNRNGIYVKMFTILNVYVVLPLFDAPMIRIFLAYENTEFFAPLIL